MSADTRARVVYYDLGVNETILCARADPEPSGLCGHTNPGPCRGVRHCLRHLCQRRLCGILPVLRGGDSSPLPMSRGEQVRGSRFTGPPRGKPPRAVTACPAAMLVAAFTSALAVYRQAAQAIPLVSRARDMPARRAALARIRGVDLLYAARSLLLQSAAQDAPARGEDLPVQPGLGAHAPAGLVDGAFRRADHAGNPQVLDTDHVESARTSVESFSAESLRASASRALSLDRGLDLTRRLLPRLARASRAGAV